MTIQVPFHLRHRSSTEPAVALLVPSREPRVLAGVLLAPGPRSLRAESSTSREASCWSWSGRRRARCPARSASGRWPRRSTSRSTPSWSRLSWTTRRVDWCATGAWSFRRAVLRCSSIATPRSI